MAKQVARKTFKIELEVTVEMEQVELPGAGLPLDRLQQALLQDEQALTREMLARAFQRLQEYADYLAAQDDLAPLLAAAQKLSDEDRCILGTDRAEFANLTRSLRVNAQSVRLESSRVTDLGQGGKAEGESQPVWVDLRPHSELGRLFEQLGVPAAGCGYQPGLKDDHYLLVRYLTHQADGAHVEARCTCETVLTAVGCDESQALDALFAAHKSHVEQKKGADLRRNWQDAGKTAFGNG